MTKDEYKAYLESDAWKRTRKHAIEGARGACQLCDANGRIDVHHRTYDRVGDERLSDLIVLCRRCHERFHGILPTPNFVSESSETMARLLELNGRCTGASRRAS